MKYVSLYNTHYSDIFGLITLPFDKFKRTVNRLVTKLNQIPLVWILVHPSEGCMHPVKR